MQELRAITSHNKHDFTQELQIALPEFPDLQTNSSGSKDILSKAIEDIISLNDDFSTIWGDFFVTSSQT